jgi:hypothetical protein
VRHEASFLLAAALSHAAFLTVGIWARRPVAPEMALSSGRNRTIEVEIDRTPPPAPPVPPPRAERVSPDKETEPQPVARAARPPEAREQGPAGPQTGNVEPEPAPAPSVNPGVPSPDGVPGGSSEPAPLPGLGGAPVWTLPGVLPDAPTAAPAPTAPPPPRPVDPKVADRVLQEGMAEQDKAKGIDLPAAGTVASTVAAAVRGSEVPADSHASIEVRLSGTGQVLGVRVVSSSSGNADAWARVAAAVKAQLAGRALAMGSTYAKGALVNVDVSSVLQLPAGPKGTHFNGSGLGFDSSNLGAHKSQVVHTSYRVAALR